MYNIHRYFFQKKMFDDKFRRKEHIALNVPKFNYYNKAKILLLV